MNHIRALSRTTLTFAEINRRAGDLAEGIGEARPSYEQVRVIVRWFRLEAQVPSLGSIWFDAAVGLRSPRELGEAIAFGTRRPLPPRSKRK
jgi:hypothetical protein